VLIAVDTNVLLDQALGTGDVLDAISTIRNRLQSAQFIVTTTVLEEIGYFSVDNGERGDAARRVLAEMRKWGYKPFPSIPAARGIIEQTALKLRATGLLPEEEINDSLVISEAAHVGCDILLSADSDVNAMERAALKYLLQNQHAANPALIIASPREIVWKFFRS
jgi:predicted nucleic acid-binding protein